MKSTFLNIAILLLLCLPAIWRIVEPGFFPTHDDTHVVRVDQMYQALKSGQFPVRWVSGLGYGYGYPIFNFYNPLPYYFGALFMFLGFDALIATKIVFVFPILISALTMWLLTRRYFGNLAATFTAIFYVYAPYHAVQIYVRGAVAEYWAYAFIPLCIYAFLSRHKLLSALSLALLVLSHNLTAMMFIPILGILFLIQLIFSKNKLLVLSSSLFAIFLGLGLSAFFWLPALTEAHLTQVNAMVSSQFNPLNHFVFPDQLWTWVWGYGGSAPGRADGLSFMIGKLHIIFTLFSLILFVFSHKIKKSVQKLLLFTASVLLLAVFMLLPISYLAWANFKILSYLQFPWRWLTFAALSTSILSGFTVEFTFKFIQHRINQHLLLLTSYLLLITFALYSAKFFQPKYKFPATAADLLTPEQVQWTISHESDEYLPPGFIIPKTPEEALGGPLPINQELLSPLLRSTPTRQVANLISLLAIVVFVLQFSHVHRRRNHSGSGSH